ESATTVQDVVQPIIHKAPVMGLAVNIHKAGLSIGDPADLRLLADGQIGVYVTVRKRFLFFPRKVVAFLGHLGPQASQIILPALDRGGTLRVRIVSLKPEHLAGPNKPEVHVSIWGDVRHLRAPVAQATASPQPHLKSQQPPPMSVSTAAKEAAPRK
ncbi:MAG: hypothetical protein U1D06_15830, partial [Paracoccaceae bacterium]|nr:hypothetical protein [Paracoccaceae bacterium]